METPSVERSFFGYVTAAAAAADATAAAAVHTALRSVACVWHCRGLSWVLSFTYRMSLLMSIQQYGCVLAIQRLPCLPYATAVGICIPTNMYFLYTK